MGNPAGVVLGVEHLTVSEMQEIAMKVGFNETAFPLKLEKGHIQIRYFTSGHEIKVCGHETIATIFALKTKGLLKEKCELIIETKAGILPIKLRSPFNAWLTKLFVRSSDIVIVRKIAFIYSEKRIGGNWVE